MWEIRRYNPLLMGEWDEFVRKGRNSTFLFERGYMDYHSDRYSDHSLMAYRRGKLSAVLPANIDGDTLWSHQGLTYGGWVWAPSGLDVADIFLLWKKWIEECQAEGLKRIIYKPLPYIYGSMPSQEDVYMLFLSGASIVQSDISTTIDLDCNPGFNKLQRRHLSKGKNAVEIRACGADDLKVLEEFHEMLSRCLLERHDTVPVHTFDELKLLMHRFPENILIWNAYERGSGKLLGAICVYDTRRCVHCQYIATTQLGRKLNALSVLVKGMIDHYQSDSRHQTDRRFFDFGISNENGGRELNIGLNRQKTSFGGSGVVYQRFDINVSYALESLPNELWPKG